MRFALASLLLVVACNAPPPEDPGVTYEKDIAPLVQAHCQTCHVPTGIAPFSLTTYDEVVLMQAAARADIEARKMPPFLAGPGCAQYQNDLRLTDAQIAMFGAWVDRGSPRGAASGANQQSVMDPPADELPRVDATMTMNARYTPMQSPDDYRCFVLDWGQTADKFVTGFRVVPGNPKVVHHVIAYIAPPAEVAEIQALDAADTTPGYACFGGPGGNVHTWLGAWAPGGVGHMYPDNTGIKVQAGSKIVLEVHYNLQSAPTDPSDQTQLQVTLEDTVALPAIIVPWTSPDWVRGRGMDIPAFLADVEHDFTADPATVLPVLTDNELQSGDGLKIYSVGMHQHLLGTASRLEILRNGDPAQSECMIDIPRWDFHWQRSYRFVESKTLHAGDQLKLTCHWDNSAEHQPMVDGAQQMPHGVRWGENSTQEMCLGLMYVTH